MSLLLVCLVAFFLTAQYSVMIATDFWLSAWSEAGARLINVTQVDMHTQIKSQVETIQKSVKWTHTFYIVTVFLTSNNQT